MASALAWMDYSEDDRRRMREVIELFRERDTLDELGIGFVRDTLAEALFPGLSTVQTRARYFLFLPWIYRSVEQREIPSSKAAVEARRLQTKLIYAMEAGGVRASEGVIGWDARENLQRLPSNVYWSGLRSFGIRLYPGSIEDYHRSLDGFYRRTHSHSKGEGDEVHVRLSPNWNPAMPPPPEDLFERTAISLRPVDAEFLRDQILLHRPDSMLALILRKPPADLPRFPWLHPALAGANAELTRSMDHARRFSEVMIGAAYAYNLMLARLAVEREMSGQYTEWAEVYEAELAAWVEAMNAPDSPLIGWDRSDFWARISELNPRLRPAMRAFLDGWFDLAINHQNDIVSLGPGTDQLIRNRSVN